MKTLEQVLADVESVVKKKDLKYHLDAKFEDSSGARVIIRWVKPFNNIIYTHMLMGGISNSPKGLAEVIEEEVVIEITTDDDKWADEWNWTKHLTDKETNKESVLRSSILDIQDALKSTDWANAHSHLLGVNKNEREVIRLWNMRKGHAEIASTTTYAISTVGKLISTIRADKRNSKLVMTTKEHNNT